jgi:PleD family two-component response regulator
MLDQMSPSQGEQTRKDALIHLCSGLQSLAHQAGQAQVSPAAQMITALEGLLRKLSAEPNHATPSVLNTIGSALDLLGRMNEPGLQNDLVTRAPARLLVVDDDALARRAVCYALQVAFGRPDSAENSRTALSLASQKHYDAIFLDVQMPDLDGFSLCSRIRQTTPNAETPVVFVTCQSDGESRAKALQAGGCDFISKPFLVSEITVKALSLVLRSRLKKLGVTTP